MNRHLQDAKGFVHIVDSFGRHIFSFCDMVLSETKAKHKFYGYIVTQHG